MDGSWAEYQVNRKYMMHKDDALAHRVVPQRYPRKPGLQVSWHGRPAHSNQTQHRSNESRRGNGADGRVCGSGE